MCIDINQYRALIGSFYNSIHRKSFSQSARNENSSAYRSKISYKETFFDYNSSFDWGISCNIKQTFKCLLRLRFFSVFLLLLFLMSSSISQYSSKGLLTSYHSSSKYSQECNISSENNYISMRNNYRILTNSDSKYLYGNRKYIGINILTSFKS